MVGKRKVYKPYSKDKLKLVMYRTYSALAGAYGTESPVLQLAVYSAASAVADRWDSYGSMASKLYNTLLAKYNVQGLQRAALRALVGAAMKYVRLAERGVKPEADAVRADLQRVLAKTGVDLENSASIIDDIVSAVASA